MKSLVVSAALCFPLFAHAAPDNTSCDANLTKWMKALHPGRTFDPAQSACKAWPANPSLTLAVQAMPEAGATDEGGKYDVEVVVADSQSGAIVAHLYEPAAIVSDAIVFRQLELDTARYQLTPRLRAFGVRVTYESSSRANPYEGQALSLYVLDGHTLRRVVDDLDVLNSNGEWDTNCAGTFSKTTRTLALGAPGASGYAALRVGETTVDSVNKLVNGDCVSADHAPKRSAATLNYDGTAYGVPKALRYQ